MPRLRPSSRVEVLRQHVLAQCRSDLAIDRSPRILELPRQAARHSERMQPITDIAVTRECNASAVVAQAARALSDRERQLAQLKACLEDYARRNAPGLGSGDAVRMQGYRTFLGRFTDAVRAQEQLVQAARHEYERKKEEWCVQRVDAAAAGSAVERMQVFERADEGQREQKQPCDETARLTRWRP